MPLFANLRAPWSPVGLGVAGAALGCVVCALVAQVVIAYVSLPAVVNYPHEVWMITDRLVVFLFAFPALLPICVCLTSGANLERRDSRIVGTMVTEDSIAIVDESVAGWWLGHLRIGLAFGAGTTLLGIVVIRFTLPSLL